MAAIPKMAFLILVLNFGVQNYVQGAGSNVRGPDCPSWDLNVWDLNVQDRKNELNLRFSDDFL